MRNSAYSAYYLRSFAVRVAINLSAIFVLAILMQQSLGTIGTFDLGISRDHSLNTDQALLATSAYAFSEATIVIALCGLMGVVLIALLAQLGPFVLVDGEQFTAFRFRLLIYTICHLLVSLALTAYLFFCVHMVVQTNSLRLNESTSFVWAYPTYSIILVLYLVEMYGFLTHANRTKT